MEAPEARRNTIKKIRAALKEKTPMPFENRQEWPEMFVNGHHDLIAQFTQEFNAVQGNVICCDGLEQLGREIEALSKEKGLKYIACSDPSILAFVSGEMQSVVNTRCAEKADAALTACEFLIARTGTIVLSSAQPSGRVLPVRAPIHLVIAYADQLVSDIGDAIERIRDRLNGRFPSAVFFASGPSRTGDIERTLILGMHGPRETFVFLVKQAGPSDDRR